MIAGWITGSADMNDGSTSFYAVHGGAKRQGTPKDLPSLGGSHDATAFLDASARCRLLLPLSLPISMRPQPIPPPDPNPGTPPLSQRHLGVLLIPWKQESLIPDGGSR